MALGPPYPATMSRDRVLIHCQHQLGKTQESLGELLGVSRRTMLRWQHHGGGPTPAGWADLARRLYTTDPELARHAAKAGGHTLDGLGLRASPPAAPAPRPPPPAPPRPAPVPRHLVDSLVCAAAEAADLMPKALRPALVAAFERARDLDLTVDSVLEGLGRTSGAAGKKR